MAKRAYVRMMAVLGLVCCLAVGLWGCSETRQAEQDQDQTQGQTHEAAALDFQDPGDDYTLKQVVMLSRHNIRAPLSSSGSVLSLATPHEWIAWTAEPSELTQRGGALETMMGQYVRTWLESEGLIPHNYRPKEGAVRFYANGKQRTRATARAFLSGMLPVSNIRVQTSVGFNKMDPVFRPQITFASDAYREAVVRQIAELGGADGLAGEDGLAGVAAGLEDSYALIQDVLDYTESVGYQSGELGDLSTTDTGVVIELGEEPGITGSLKLAKQLSDALVLQFYEAPSSQVAAFGKDLTLDQWRLIAKVKDTYLGALFAAPLVATNVAHPLLLEIGGELDAQGREFSFLCGHDSNIASVLSALDAYDYELPGAIEAKTPIGSKVVFEKWEAKDGVLYGRVRLMYQSVDQLRTGSMIGGYEAPHMVEINLKGLQKNEDGLYSYEDMRGRIAEAADAYDQLLEDYGPKELDQAA